MFLFVFFLKFSQCVLDFCKKSVVSKFDVIERELKSARAHSVYKGSKAGQLK